MLMLITFVSGRNDNKNLWYCYVKYKMYLFLYLS